MVLKQILMIVLVSLALSACLPQGQAHPSRPAPAGDDVIKGFATIEALDVLILETYPVQVRVLARGYLQDACTEVDQVLVEGPTNSRFKITITTARPADAVCAQMLKTFQRSVPLDTAGLPLGEYTVEVNGLRRTFVLDSS